MKLFCSLLLLLLYLAPTGRASDAQLLRQDDAVSLQYSREGDPELRLSARTKSIDATWHEVPGASYYNISWTPNNGTNIVDGTSSSSGTYTYPITDLVSCTNYTVTVQPGDDETNVGGPLTASTTTLSHAPPDPDPVTTVTVATVVDQSSLLDVSWPKVEGPVNCAVTYRITWTPASGGGSRQATTTALTYTITGLAASSTFTVCVPASTDGEMFTNDRCSSGTTGVDSVCGGDPTLQLQATAESIEATWDEVPGASYYNISWTPDGNGTNIVDGGSGSGTYTYTITDLVSCTNYTVTVQPGNNDSNVGGPFTAFKPTLSHEPERVTTVTVATVVDQSSLLDVSWPMAEGAGNCFVTYRITWTPASGGGSSQNTTSELSYTITGLTACTTYTVCVAAKTDTDYTDDRCGRGTTAVDTPGPVVMGPLATLNESSLRVSWDPPLNFNCEILYYTVKWTPKDTNKSIVNTTTTSYTITGLAACTSYTVTVTAATSKDLGVETSKSSATDSIAPDSPEVTAAMVVNKSDKLNVSWTKPDDPGPMCPVTWYNVTWYLAGTQELVGQKTTKETNFAIGNLEAWTNYTVCVAAATEQNLEQKYSKPNCTLAVTDQDTPGPPSDTEIESHTGESLLVVWRPPEKPRGIITSYSVACSPPDTENAPPAPSVTCKKIVSPYYLTVTWPKVDTQCPVSGYKVNYTGDVLWSDDTRHGSQELQTTYADLSDLTPWTTYTVCVAGVVVNDIVGAWNCCSSTTLEDAPGPPAELTVASVSSETVTVSWAPPEALNGVLTDYQVVWDNGYTNLTSNVTTYTVSNRQPKSQFTVTVKAGTTAGWGPPAVVCGTTDDDVNVGAVVGGVVGGLLLLALLVAAVFFRHKIMDTFQAAKHSRPLPPVTIVHPGDQVKKDVMTHDPAHINALHSGSHVPRALREEVLQHEAPCVQSPGGLAMNTVNTYPHSNHIYENEIFDEDDPIYISLD